MSLREFHTVDIVMRVPGDRVSTALIAYDSGDVSEPREREALLQKKLAFYLEYVRSGQFGKGNPDLAEHPVCIEVVCLLPPTKAMLQIESIQDRDATHSIPVNVTSDQEFRARLGLKPRTP